MNGIKVRILLALGILFVIASLPVYAQGLEPPIPAAPPDGKYILDRLNWLTTEQENTINTIVRGLDRDGVAEIGVVTLDDCGPDKKAYRKSLFDTWGIGHANENDGLLILVCWYGGDASRRSVEQLYSRGLNGILTSGRTDKIAQENFVPAFQADKPGEGLVSMVRTYNVLLRTSTSSNTSLNPIVQYVKGLDEGTIFTSVSILLVAILLLLNKFLPSSVRERIEEWSRSSGDRWGDRGGGDGFGGGNSDGGGGSSTRF